MRTVHVESCFKIIVLYKKYILDQISTIYDSKKLRGKQPEFFLKKYITHADLKQSSNIFLPEDKLTILCEVSKIYKFRGNF